MSSRTIHAGALDSGWAVKLVKRLKKAAQAISARSKATKPGQKELEIAFDVVDAALRDHDAGRLVTANAALRSTDDATGVNKSQ